MKTVAASAAIAVMLAIGTTGGTTVHAADVIGLGTPPLLPFGLMLVGAAVLLLWLRNARVER